MQTCLHAGLASCKPARNMLKPCRCCCHQQQDAKSSFALSYDRAAEGKADLFGGWGRAGCVMYFATCRWLALYTNRLSFACKYIMSNLK